LYTDKLLETIVTSSDGKVNPEWLIGDLGHPVYSQLIVQNSDLYPELDVDYEDGDVIPSKIGSWVFGYLKTKMPEGIDVDLKFTVDADEPIQLVGPAVMTLFKIPDAPTGQVVEVTDVFGLAQPTPLRGGCPVVLANFDDVGLGIIASYPREYLFEQEWVEPVA
jgi:hypothetical protein